MTDSPPESTSPAEPPPESPLPPHRWWHHWKALLTIGLATPLVLYGLFTAVTLTWSYSQGQRAGYLQKFSRKGWACKTGEGGRAMTPGPGVAPTRGGSAPCAGEIQGRRRGGGPPAQSPPGTAGAPVLPGAPRHPVSLFRRYQLLRGQRADRPIGGSRDFSAGRGGEDGRG